MDVDKRMETAKIRTIPGKSFLDWKASSLKREINLKSKIITKITLADIFHLLDIKLIIAHIKWLCLTSFDKPNITFLGMYRA